MEIAQEHFVFVARPTVTSAKDQTQPNCDARKQADALSGCRRPGRGRGNGADEEMFHKSINLSEAAQE